MTRSVEIPDETVRKALATYLADNAAGAEREEAMRAALEAVALPYLVPAAEESEQIWPADAYPEHMAPAPAGDGGLREALEKLKRYCSGYVDGDGSEDEQLAYDDIHIQLSQILQRYPAAAAVPQPVDREALRDLLSDFVDSDDCWYDHHGYCQAHGWFRTDPACPHARAKAVLAGEQEQVEP